MGAHCSTCSCQPPERLGRLIVVGPSQRAIDVWAMSPDSDHAMATRDVTLINAQRYDSVSRLRGMALTGQDDVMWLDGARVAPHSAMAVAEITKARYVGRIAMAADE